MKHAQSTTVSTLLFTQNSDVKLAKQNKSVFWYYVILVKS